MDYVRSIVEKDLGRPLDEVFVYFDPVPIGAASIGQVHRATLKTPVEVEGELLRDVVVKVQYPGVESTFRIDMKTIKGFCKLAQPEHLPMLDEIERQFMTEFDYHHEAQHLHTVWRNITPVFPEVKVPLPVHSLCAKHVLVMEYLPGVKLIKGIRDQYERLARGMGMTLAELEEKQRQITEGKPAPTSRQIKLYTAALRTRDSLTNALVFLYNWTLGWVLRKREYVHTPLPLNIPWILDLLMRGEDWQAVCLFLSSNAIAISIASQHVLAQRKPSRHAHSLLLCFSPQSSMQFTGTRFSWMGTSMVTHTLAMSF